MNNFNFGEVLSQAWQIIWKHKILWVLASSPVADAAAEISIQIPEAVVMAAGAVNRLRFPRK